MIRYSLIPTAVFLLTGCASQEGKSSASSELNAAVTTQQNQIGKSDQLDRPDPLFDPGPLTLGDNEVKKPDECSGEVVSFTWNSGELDSTAINRQIITANGYVESDGMRLEISWSRHKMQRQWSGFEINHSFEHWKTWLEQPVSEGGATLSGSMKSKLTVIHSDNCQRSGFPVQTDAWARLNAWVLSQIGSTDADSSSLSQTRNGEAVATTESSTDKTDSPMAREQVVFALEKAEDIKSVRLVCENQWEERTGVRNGRARFEDVPAVECQVGWIGDRKGWFKIPAEWSLVQCIFETNSVDCQSL